MIIIDEYAELAGDPPDAMSDTGTIARPGRAPAVTLAAATQRPTQKVMGQGAVRFPMNIRISFRAGEQRGVDLILGQGKLKARVCTYIGIISACTCTKPAAHSVTNRNHRPPRFATNRGSHRA